MTPDNVMDLGREAMTVTVLLAAPLLLSALFMGLVVGLFQAATQIQEQTLSFILQVITDFTSQLIIDTVPRVLGV